VYRGHEGVRQYVADLGDAWDVFSVEIRDSIAAGQVVLAVGCLRYRGKGSGVEAESPAGYVIKFRSGKVVRLNALRDPERAFEMVGETG
jgi:ketosteroid isomerase-like protein